MIALIKSSIKIVIFAAILGIAFNIMAPQGIGFLPKEVSRPQWLEADIKHVGQLVKQGALLIDARPAGDYNQSRIRGAVKLPVEELEALYPLLADTITQAPAVVVYGRSFSRFPAATVGQYLAEQGISNVYVTEASLEELTRAGLPIQEPRRRAE